MTDKPHTPTDDSSGTLHKDFVRDLFEMGAVYFEYVKTGIDAEPHFNRWYEAEIADAEQRGAISAFRKTQEIIAGFDHMYREYDDMINTDYLIQEIDTEIQDLMEDDDDEGNDDA